MCPCPLPSTRRTGTRPGAAPTPRVHTGTAPAAAGRNPRARTRAADPPATTATPVPTATDAPAAPAPCPGARSGHAVALLSTLLLVDPLHTRAARNTRHWVEPVGAPPPGADRPAALLRPPACPSHPAWGRSLLAGKKRDKLRRQPGPPQPRPLNFETRRWSQNPARPRHLSRLLLHLLQIPLHQRKQTQHRPFLHFLLIPRPHFLSILRLHCL